MDPQTQLRVFRFDPDAQRVVMDPVPGAPLDLDAFEYCCAQCHLAVALEYDLVSKVTGGVFSKKYIMLGRIVTQWEDIVGKELSGKAQPVKIRYFKSKNDARKATASLDIAVSSADATVLHYQKDLILERINRIFGDNWITAIRFVPKAAEEQQKRPLLRRRQKQLTVAEKQSLSEIVKDIPDPDMQKKLMNLGTAILQDRS
jgi:hypothetical protein